MMLALVALFLPLFPLSVVQNLILARLQTPALRAAVLLLWPQIGVTLLYLLQPQLPDFVVPWAVLSAAIYALRLLTVRDLGLWAAMYMSSALALIWEPITRGADSVDLRLFALWFSLPAALLTLLSSPLARRIGAAYAGLFAGLGETQPRLAFVLTIAVLSTIATPPSPGFFALLDLLNGLGGGAMLGVLGVWLVWGWAATRLLQGFIAGTGRELTTPDLARSSMLTYSAALAVFALIGFLFSGGNL